MGASGFAPVITIHLTWLSVSAQAQNFLSASITSEFRAFNLFGRFMVANATNPLISWSFTATFSIDNTSDMGASITLPRQSP